MPGMISRVRATLPRLSRVLRAFLPRVRPHGMELGTALVLGAVVAVTEVVKPWPLQIVFDLVLGASPTAPPHRLHGPSALFQPMLEAGRRGTSCSPPRSPCSWSR
jgi:hypothetical protein